MTLIRLAEQDKNIFADDLSDLICTIFATESDFDWDKASSENCFLVSDELDKELNKWLDKDIAECLVDYSFETFMETLPKLKKHFLNGKSAKELIQKDIETFKGEVDWYEESPFIFAMLS